MLQDLLMKGWTQGKSHCDCVQKRHTNDKRYPEALPCNQQLRDETLWYLQFTEHDHLNICMKILGFTAMNCKNSWLLTACWQLPSGRWSEPHGSWSPSSSCESDGPAGAGRKRSFWSGWCASLWNPRRTDAEGSHRWSSRPHVLQSLSEAHKSIPISLHPKVSRNNILILLERIWIFPQLQSTKVLIQYGNEEHTTTSMCFINSWIKWI